ncbi:hypothetical protein F5X97DRAFT_314680 [Nemania serpens]|nr:hypothetical protein F5X97DRAFT_314680 [Nemania serpens]
MKTSFVAIVATLAASVAAMPHGYHADTKAVPAKREEIDGPILESINYILKLQSEGDGIDPYQDEVDSVKNPADVLGRRVNTKAAPVKREEIDGPILESINYILKLQSEGDAIDPYQDEVDSVKNPADVLGKREEIDGPILESINYILKLQSEGDAIDPYQDEVDSVKNPADVLG